MLDHGQFLQAILDSPNESRMRRSRSRRVADRLAGAESSTIQLASLSETIGIDLSGQAVDFAIMPPHLPAIEQLP